MEMSLLFLNFDTRGIVKGLLKIIDHTADVGIIAYGTDIEQLFCNAAL